jgi:ABC-type lipoprotein release transport system permease subunit
VPYLISVVAVAAGVVVLLTVLVRLSGSARRLAATVSESRAHVAPRTRALAMRIAELRIAVNRRLHRTRSGSHPATAA